MNDITGKNNQLYKYVWKNLDKELCPHRVRLNNRFCVVLARGKMNSVKIQFLDNKEQHIVSRFALRKV